MRVVATIESRMLSTRLPGKNARPILGRPMLARLIERLRRARTVDVVCLATTTDPSDDPLCAIAREAGAQVYRGSVDDVLGRVLGAARSVNADLITEITGDCPLTDPGIVDAAVTRYRRGDVDYVANILDGLTFPAGLDVQVFSTALLYRADWPGKGARTYSPGLCPVAERLYDHELFFHAYLYEALKGPWVDAIVRAFEKVWAQRGALGDVTDNGTRAIRRA